MRTVTDTYNVYKFDELSKEVQQTVIDKNRYYDVEDDFWYDFIKDDVIDIGELFGISIKDIYFSGFSSQGDGACFTGSFSHVPGILKAVKEHAPNDSDLHEIVARIATMLKQNFYQIYGKITHSGHYNHSGCMRVSLEREDNKTVYCEDDLIQCFRDFADWLYKRLKNEYKYLTTDVYIKERLNNNDCEYTDTGKLV